MRHPLARALPAAASVALIAGAAPFVRPTPAILTAAPTRGMFAVLRGSDTLVTERFTRSDDRLEAELTARGPRAAGQPQVRYDAALRPDASVARLVLSTVGPNASPGGSGAMSATFQEDSVLLVQDTDSLRRPAARGMVPYVNPSPSLMEQIVRRARALGGTRGGPAVPVPVLLAEGGQTGTATVTFPAADSARLDIANVVVALRVDGNGAVLGGSVPAQGVTIVRAAATP